MSRNGRMELEENALRKLCLFFSVTMGADVCNSAQSCVSFQGNTLCALDIVIIISPYLSSDGFPRHFVMWGW